MAKFRKKPVEVEAVRYAGNGNLDPRGGLPDWLWKALEDGTARFPNGRDPFIIRTLEGEMPCALICACGAVCTGPFSDAHDCPLHRPKLVPAASPEAADRLNPPQHIIDLAVEVSGWSPCRSKRGVVIFSGGNVISHGYNYKPRGFDCDGSEACKATCRREAIHAEQQALLSSGGRPLTDGAEMLHVKTVDGKLVPSDGPSCVECSKLARAAGIAWVWLYHEDGWRRYTGEEFHRLSLRAGAAPPSATTP